MITTNTTVSAAGKQYLKNSQQPFSKFKKQSFTLLEIVIAIAIFSMSIAYLLEKRNSSVEDSYYARQLLEAQTIIDDIFADYRLHPFAEEARPLEKDYSPFEVDVNVQKESINIIPEDWRLDDTFLEGTEQEKKKRIILRISVTINFTGLDEKIKHKVEASTLIRLIELDDELDANTK